MRLSTAYSLLVEQELRNKGRFDILSTAMQLMEESDSNCNSRVIDLTGDKSVPEFVNLSKDPEVFNLCSSSSDSSICSSDSSVMPSACFKVNLTDILVLQQDWWEIRSSASLIDWNAN